MFKIHQFLKIAYNIKRTFSNIQNPHNVLEHLKERSIIKISGQEVSNFLQGLITNDIKNLDTNNLNSIYATFLNTKGRILYDTIIYKTLEPNTYLIECDQKIATNLSKHLKIYRVRRKIDINVENELNIYVIFNKSLNITNPITPTKNHKDLLIYRDPRLVQLGSRIISKPNVDINKQISDLIKINDNSSIVKINYRQLRYHLGVGEGVNDLPPENCFALESNCDYLHGVSFEKGCYIGQELTARVHHTGVIRKRLMPIHFTKIPNKLPDDNKIVHEGVSLGKLRGIEGDVGLGLMRIGESLKVKEISIGDGTGYVVKSNWWPVEAPKQKIAI